MAKELSSPISPYTGNRCVEGCARESRRHGVTRDGDDGSEIWRPTLARVSEARWFDLSLVYMELAW